MCHAQGHNAVLPVRLEVVILECRVTKSCVRIQLIQYPHCGQYTCNKRIKFSFPRINVCQVRAWSCVAARTAKQAVSAATHNHTMAWQTLKHKCYVVIVTLLKAHMAYMAMEPSAAVYYGNEARSAISHITSVMNADQNRSFIGIYGLSQDR